MENKKLIQEWYQQVWNNKNESAIDTYLAKNCIAHGLADENNEEIVGTEKFKLLYRKFIAAFPDIQFNVLQTVNEGNTIAALVEASFSHSGGTFQAYPGKDIAPSGRPVKISGITITVIENGQIQEAWNSFDFLTMYTTLGVF